MRKGSTCQVNVNAEKLTATDIDKDILNHLGGVDYLKQEEKELIKNIMPKYDDFHLQTSWQMKKKFVFAKPGKKRFVSQCLSRPTGLGL